MVTNAMELRNNSYLKNEATGVLVLGGVLQKDRSKIASLTAEQLIQCLSDRSFTFLCSSKSKLWNYGVVCTPPDTKLSWSDESGGVTDKGRRWKR